MDNVVLLEQAPNRENAIRFMDFLLQPENIAQVTNYAQYAAASSVRRSSPKRRLATSPRTTRARARVPGVFIEVCDQATQEVYDQIWTRLRSVMRIGLHQPHSPAGGYPGGPLPPSTAALANAGRGRG